MLASTAAAEPVAAGQSRPAAAAFDLSRAATCAALITEPAGAATDVAATDVAGADVAGADVAGTDGEAADVDGTAADGAVGGGVAPAAVIKAPSAATCAR